MEIVSKLMEKGYLYYSDEPGFYLKCKDTTIGYKTWDKDVQALQAECPAPFGMIVGKSCSDKGSRVLFDQMRDNWNDLNHDPEVLILTTSKCNLDCPYCIIGVQKADKFSLPTIEQVEKAFKLFPVKRVVITGGEPLTEKERFIELVNYLKGKIERLDIITNGLAWDEDIWPTLIEAGQTMELWMRVTLSESLSHMRLSYFEEKILPLALLHHEIKINMTFLPNHNGKGLLNFLKQVNALNLPKSITVTPSYLTESKVSNKVEFDIAGYLEDVMEVAEHPEAYIDNINFDSGRSFYLLANDIQLLGCKRRTITLSDKGYALCNIFHCEGQVFKGPLEAAQFIWERLVKVCKDCDHYPDNCMEAIKEETCERFKLGCQTCPIIYVCALRCPYAFEVDKDTCVGQTDLQCLGYPLLRIFNNWLMYRNRTWDEVRQEVRQQNQCKEITA